MVKWRQNSNETLYISIIYEYHVVDMSCQAIRAGDIVLTISNPYTMIQCEASVLSPYMFMPPAALEHQIMLSTGFIYFNQHKIHITNMT